MDEELKKAAMAYSEEHNDECFDAIGCTCPFIINAFLAGAEWMAKQGETYETRVIENGLSNLKIIQHTVESFEPDEQVIVQIRKK